MKNQPKLFLFILSGIIYFQNTVFAQITDSDKKRMRKEATDCVESYFIALNQIGSTGKIDQVWRDSDIEYLIKNYLESSDVAIYNDLDRKPTGIDFMEAKKYLNTIHEKYPLGVKFTKKMNLKEPCFKGVGSKKFFIVIVEVEKTLSGTNNADGGILNKTDSLNIYVKFPVLQLKPKLQTGKPVIYSILPHAETFCVVEEEE